MKRTVEGIQASSPAISSRQRSSHYLDFGCIHRVLQTPGCPFVSLSVCLSVALSRSLSRYTRAHTQTHTTCLRVFTDALDPQYLKPVGLRDAIPNHLAALPRDVGAVQDGHLSLAMKVLHDVVHRGGHDLEPGRHVLVVVVVVELGLESRSAPLDSIPVFCFCFCFCLRLCFCFCFSIGDLWMTLSIRWFSPHDQRRFHVQQNMNAKTYTYGVYNMPAESETRFMISVEVRRLR